MLKSINMRKKVIFITFLLGIVLVFIFVEGIAMLGDLRKLENDIQKANLISRSEEYSLKVSEKIENSFELLISLAPFFSIENSISKENLYISNNNNTFYKMGYFSKSSDRVIRTIKDKKVETKLDFKDIEKEVVKIVKQSFQGKKAISEIYMDKDFNKKGIAFSVPIYKDNEIEGVLVGSYYLDDLERKIFKTNSTVKENVDLIDKTGKIIIYSKQSITPRNTVENLFDLGTYSQEQIKIIKEKMEQNEVFQIYFTYKNQKNISLYLPIRNTNWYLIYTDTENSDFREFYIKLSQVRKKSGFLVLISLVISFWLCRNLINGQKKIERLAYYDKMTGAYNITKFEELLKESNNIKYIAVVNIRKFRYINKIFGKSKGDKLILVLDKAIEKNLLSDEFYCREYADQFLIALKREDKDFKKDRELKKQRLNKIIKVLEEYSKDVYFGYKIEINIGLTFKLKTLDSIMERIGFALKEAKNQKGSTLIFWSDIEKKFSDIHFYVESRKEEALKNKEFKLFFQPKKNFRTGEYDSAEVLVRWIKKDGAIIYPSQFISAFEENGFCVSLDMYILEETCKVIRNWLDKGLKVPKLSINQSKFLFYREDYLDILCRMTDKYKVDRSYIVLEILENFALENVDRMGEIIEKIRAKGFKVSIDDFGSGYSSLNMLGNLHVDEIKLDRNFLLNMNNQKNNKTIIENIVKMANELEISVVAEGIEEKSSEDFLKLSKIEYGQGYYYSKPISLESFEKRFM